MTIDGVRFFGIAYNHPSGIIPEGTDVVITHEPPMGILDETMGMNWGSAGILKRVSEIKPNFHLFGHAHEAHGEIFTKGITFSNGSLLNDFGEVVYSPTVLDI